ncbi:hypothetical protein BOTCAL_0155g00090 [Botryotinia calthae]|uniref:Uncharacterized protein n=1 Tax=Botryotinia calthae TaxID=38488 RepID=A0A4Y8D4G4_9HELO|nr:hypothetical protein BOTCAL_0155g00090 [Botryotinia calthae]
MTTFMISPSFSSTFHTHPALAPNYLFRQTNSDIESQMTPLILDRESLYITLNRLENDVDLFHWGIYLWKGLAKSDGIGKYFHVTDRNCPDKFLYEETRSPDIRRAINVLVALKIAIVKPAQWDRLGELLSQVHIHELTTCRTWVLEALKALDKEGIVKLKDGGVENIERECLKYARIRGKIIQQSDYCKF